MSDIQIDGIHLTLPDSWRSTRTTRADRTFTDRFFCPPSIVVALEVDGSYSDSTLAASYAASSLLHAYSERPGYVAGAFAPVAIAGAVDALGLSFGWHDDQAVAMMSAAVVARRSDGSCVIVHATAPALAGDEVAGTMEQIVTGMRIDSPDAGEPSGVADQ